MPKGSSKSKKKKGTSEEGATGGGLSGLLSVSQLVMDEDSESVCSSIPDSVISDEGVSESVDESDSDSELQLQLSEHIDQLIDKNARVRMTSINFLSDTMRKKLVVNHLTGRIDTLTDFVIKGIKKVHGQERCNLLSLSALLSVQLGLEYSDIYSTLSPHLLTLVRDHTVPTGERAMALNVLTFCAFLLCQDVTEVSSIMTECESIFTTTKSEPLIVAAAKGWSLLLSIVPTQMVPTILIKHLPHLTAILNGCGDLDVRIAIGQAVALLFELTREIDEELLECDSADTLCGVVQAIAAESNRYTGRKERNHQRACFRDILSAVESGGVPERSVKFGLEVLSLDSWARLVQYNTITDLLGTGVKAHLQNNELLREIFQLGLPVLEQRESKADKRERKQYNIAVAKVRQQSRSKQRDKRAVL